MGRIFLGKLSHTIVGNGPVEMNFLYSLRFIYALVWKFGSKVPEEKEKWLNGLDYFAINVGLYMRKVINEGR